jgi:hypothetical protein
MFKLLFVAAFLAAFSVFAGEISDVDIATYELDGKNGQPSNMQIRLSKANGKWVMEGKEGISAWKNISCDAGCEFRVSSIDERAVYLSEFPDGMQRRFDIACIQNVANAFCRLVKKDDSSKGGYALVALVTGKPVAISLRRLAKP